MTGNCRLLPFAGRGAGAAFENGPAVLKRRTSEMGNVRKDCGLILKGNDKRQKVKREHKEIGLQ